MGVSDDVCYLCQNNDNREMRKEEGENTVYMEILERNILFFSAMSAIQRCSLMYRDVDLLWVSTTVSLICWDEIQNKWCFSKTRPKKYF